MLKYILLSYLIGSIPFAYICARLFHGSDIRYIGSQNVGTTNVIKQVGWLPGLLTLVGDMCKGWAATIVGALAPLQELQFVTPAFAIVGHNWPVWLEFKGGGGLATFVGSCLAFNDYGSIVFGLATWGVFYCIFKDHDLSALSACVVAPVLCLIIGESLHNLVFYFSSSFVIALRRIQSMMVNAHRRMTEEIGA